MSNTVLPQAYMATKLVGYFAKNSKTSFVTYVLVPLLKGKFRVHPATKFAKKTLLSRFRIAFLAHHRDIQEGRQLDRITNRQDVFIRTHRGSSYCTTVRTG